MKITQNNIIGEIVAEDYRMAKVFDKYKIDFCCNGDRPIQTATKAKNIDTEEVVDALNQILADEQNGSEFKTMELDKLADYIEKTHHAYVEENIPLIKKYLKKISVVHGDRHPDLHKVKEIFSESAGDLASHMKKEELILFPMIRNLVKAENENTTFTNDKVGTINNPIKKMMQEHDHEGEHFREIRALTDDYTLPEDACSSYSFAFKMLEEFEGDLHKHIHLENNILFPRSRKLEEKMNAIA